MRFTIIVVSLNAGDELLKTVESVRQQSYKDYEILIKDGGSTDGSIEQLPADRSIRLIRQKDVSIYDAMNQAVQKAAGEYFLFLNCGDYLADERVLARAAKALVREPADILYGDLYRRRQKSVDVSPGRITDFVCYRNVPCHQVCFYARKLFAKRAYITKYRVRADYEHFLYCYYEEHARCRHISLTVCSYQGGGFSETEEHRKEAATEHREITKHYQGIKAFAFRVLMILTLQPLREKLAGDPRFSAGYHKLKGLLYGKTDGGRG